MIDEQIQVQLPAGEISLRSRGEGRPLILLHGWGMSGEVFAPLLDNLDDNIRVLIPDLPGHGANWAYPHLFTTDDFAALIDAVAPKGAVVMGWSMGGQLLLRSAPALADRLKGLILCGTSPRFTQTEGWEAGLPSMQVVQMLRQVKRDPEGKVREFRALSDKRIAAMDLPLPTLEAATEGLQLLLDLDLRESVRAIKTRTLIVHGERDGIIPVAAGRYLASCIEGSEEMILPDAGHAPFLDTPVFVAAAISSLFERCFP